MHFTMLCTSQSFLHDSTTVTLNYNFISAHMDMCGNTRYFTCKMLKFAIEIKISTRRIVEFPLEKTWIFHDIWHFHKT